MVCLASASPTVHTSIDELHTSSDFFAACARVYNSRSLGASFTELTGQPTLPCLHVLGPSIVAPITGTIETLPSSVASSEPPATVIPAKSQAAPVPDPTQTTLASLLAIEGQTAQSLGSDDDGTQFQLAPRTSAPDSSAVAPPIDP